jgi:peptidoglycan/LPS O-acetylase OafA/YrhL
VLAIANLIGISGLDLPAPAAPGQLSRAVRWCAGATFTIYLFHLSVTQFGRPSCLASKQLADAPRHACGRARTLMFAVAELTERRKQGWRRLFWRATEGFAGVHAAAAVQSASAAISGNGPIMCKVGIADASAVSVLGASSPAAGRTFSRGGET